MKKEKTATAPVRSIRVVRSDRRVSFGNIHYPWGRTEKKVRPPAGKFAPVKGV